MIAMPTMYIGLISSFFFFNEVKKKQSVPYVQLLFVEVCSAAGAANDPVFWELLALKGLEPAFTSSLCVSVIAPS